MSFRLDGLAEFEAGLLADVEAAGDLVRAEVIDAVATVHVDVLANWPVDTGFSRASFDVFPNAEGFTTPEEAKGSQVHGALSEGDLRRKLKDAGKGLRRAFYTNGAPWSGFVEDGTTKMPARKVVESALTRLGSAE